MYSAAITLNTCRRWEVQLKHASSLKVNLLYVYMIFCFDSIQFMQQKKIYIEHRYRMLQCKLEPAQKNCKISFFNNNICNELHRSEKIYLLLFELRTID